MSKWAYRKNRIQEKKNWLKNLLIQKRNKKDKIMDVLLYLCFMNSEEKNEKMIIMKQVD